MAVRAPAFEDVEAAATRIDGAALRTPACASERLDAIAGCHVVLKCENLQRAGAFKIRGATNAIRALLERGRPVSGVAAHSSGNHAQAVALAAREHGLAAAILMPSDAPPEKLEATRTYGAEVVLYDRYREERSTLAARLAEERGYVSIPPYEHPDVVAGQGTAALELFEDAGPLDALVVPVGGGGLLAGSALAAAGCCPTARVIGVEPEVADDARRSLAAGSVVHVDTAPTICDGQQAPVGDLTFSVFRSLVDRVVAVADDDVRSAMRVLFEAAKLVAEPSGACALAGLLHHRDSLGLRDARVGVILSGGNVSAGRFAALVGDA
jgi:threo-3-hydroxy-L-aspartate ammonia-lyase